MTKKERIRQQHPQYGKMRIEVAHIIDHFLGGTSDEENLKPMTLPEHLIDHVTKAMDSDNWQIASRQYGAAHLIASRMTEEENEIANAMMPKIRRRV